MDVDLFEQSELDYVQQNFTRHAVSSFGRANELSRRRGRQAAGRAGAGARGGDPVHLSRLCHEPDAGAGPGAHLLDAFRAGRQADAAWAVGKPLDEIVQAHLRKN